MKRYLAWYFAYLVCWIEGVEARLSDRWSASRRFSDAEACASVFRDGER